MYAQVIWDEARSAKRPETHERATHELVSAMREQPGFVGAMSLVDRDGGRVMMVVLWETAEQARRPLSERGPRRCTDSADAAPAVDKGPQSSIWQVTARI
jgi:heme-degrading monooxygenase HmoA